MTKILICDDESGIRMVLKKYASFEGYEVLEAENGLEAVNICKNNEIDMIIMDVMMPVMDGFTAVEEIRKFSNVPIIMLTARGEEYDKILGYKLLIDDYVVKPFSSKEVMLRISAILRRTVKEKPDKNIYKKEDLEVDFDGYKVTIDGEVINMAPKEYELLFYLVRNKGIVVTREKLLSNIWGYDYYGDDRTLDTHMKLLRKSLGRYSVFITTLRGVGYRFDE